MDFMRDAVWQSVGAILAFFALGISLWIYFKQRETKVIGYGITITPLLTIDHEIKNKLKIYYNDHEVAEAVSAKLTISNKGNRPITKVDYDEPIVVQFGKNGQLVTVDGTQDTNIKITTTIYYDNNSFIITPILLNPSDYITVKCVFINGHPEICVNARIIGGELANIEELNKRFPAKYLLIASNIFEEISQSKAKRDEFFAAIIIFGIIIAVTTFVSSESFDRVIKFLDNRTELLGQGTAGSSQPAPQ